MSETPLSRKEIDISPTSPLHTLGNSHTQSAYGDHKIHPLDSVLTGSRSGGAALVSVIAALVELGAVDNTTP